MHINTTHWLKIPQLPDRFDLIRNKKYNEILIIYENIKWGDYAAIYMLRTFKASYCPKIQPC